MDRFQRMFPGHARAGASRAAALLLLSLLAAGCARSLPGEPNHASGEPTHATGPLLVIPAARGEQTTRLDHAHIVAASVEGDLLRLGVEFGGGCRPHHFSLLHDGVFMESFPVQTRLQLAHDAHGDQCRALLRRRLEFDLTPLRDAYLRAYGEGGTLILHVTAPGGGESVASRLHYTF